MMCPPIATGGIQDMNGKRKKATVKRIVVSVKEAHECKVHRPGDQIVFDCVGDASVRLSGTICLGALTSLMPKVYAFHNNARFRWAEEADAVVHACPDPKTPVVFEVRREFE
ncbi:MAG: TIGR04076 family protein [Planctomycetes bacterium]|nr:TIGR04076 family protein [Planctomycetota bacterium]